MMMKTCSLRATASTTHQQKTRFSTVSSTIVRTSTLNSPRTMTTQRPRTTCCVAEPGSATDNKVEGAEPEEDNYQIAGQFDDAANPNTKLGKAIRSACTELEHLNSVELSVLEECSSLLQKLGYKGNIMTSTVEPIPQQSLHEMMEEISSLQAEQEAIKDEARSQE